jgi:hypothetical protein
MFRLLIYSSSGGAVYIKIVIFCANYVGWLLVVFHSKPASSQPTKYAQNTGCLQKNGAVSKINKTFISHLTWAKLTPSVATTVQVFYSLIIILQYVQPGSQDKHPHDNRIRPL